MNTQQRIDVAKQRIKELELLIHHWEKANGTHSKSQMPSKLSGSK